MSKRTNNCPHCGRSVGPAPKTPPELFVHITPIPGERLAYMARTEGSVDEYRVELNSMPTQVDGVLVINGSCGCPNFEYVRAKIVRSGKISMCRHLKAAWIFAMQQIVLRVHTNEGIRERRY